MTIDETDPYSTYLQLPPGPRPPNFYDLLGLELFCSHHERINQAVRKQFRVIKRYHDHHDRDARETIQDIMNAIATSRVVLTDPVRKEEYDIELAKQLGIDRDAHLAAMVAAALPENEISVVAGPTLVEHRFALIEGTRFSIGHGARCLLAVHPERAAERHCVIHHTDGEWLLKPADRTFIVQVNGNVVQEFVLAHGDLIDVAGYRLLFSRIDRRDEVRATRSAGPPPLSLITQKGPSTASPIFNVLPPQRVVIGHGDTALWQLADTAASRYHCAIESIGRTWEIEDLDSTNGTKVNGVKVARRLLSDRDMITLGSFEILVSLRF